MAIVLLLQARGDMAAPELAEELEVSTRTIYRDVEALSGAGVPVYAERGAGGGIRLLDGYRTDLTGMSPGEAETLFLMGMPGPLDELGLGGVSDAAQRKLLAALPAAGRATAERVRQRVHVDATGWDRAPRRMTWLPVVARAVWGERRMEMTYVRADNRELQYSVDPLGLVLKGGQWYLVALVGDYDVTFRISRIRHAEVGDEAVKRPKDFDLAAYWAESVKEFDEHRAQVQVRLRVHVSHADDLPRLLGEGLRFQLDERLPDASSDGFVVLDLSYESLSDARADLLGVGPSIEVVEPAELRTEIADVAARVVELYARTPS
jgi:predicted DNA-binding transcriptional regulator YafY